MIALVQELVTDVTSCYVSTRPRITCGRVGIVEILVLGLGIDVTCCNTRVGISWCDSMSWLRSHSDQLSADVATCCDSARAGIIC